MERKVKWVEGHTKVNSLSVMLQKVKGTGSLIRWAFMGPSRALPGSRDATGSRFTALPTPAAQLPVLFP